INTVLEMPAKPRMPGIVQVMSNLGYSALFASLMLLIALVTPLGLSAQGTTGAITGTVTDPSGAVVPGATVTIRQVDTKGIKTTPPTEAGTCAVTLRKPGNYSVK